MSNEEKIALALYMVGMSLNDFTEKMKDTILNQTEIFHVFAMAQVMSTMSRKTFALPKLDEISKMLGEYLKLQKGEIHE
jgi:hypothetical protein